MRLAKLNYLVNSFGDERTSPRAQRDHRAALAFIHVAELLRRELMRLQLQGLISLVDRDSLVDQFEMRCVEILSVRRLDGASS